MAEPNDPPIDSPPPGPIEPPAWRKDDDGKLPADPARPSPRSKVAVGLVSVLTMGVVVYGAFLWLRPLPQPVLATWWVADYPQLPAVSLPFAEQDRASLSQETYFSHRSPQIQSLTHAAGHETVVVYLSGQARLDDHGKVLLLTTEADVGSSESSIPFQQILTTLSKSSAKHKLLIVDFFWPLSDPFLADSLQNIPQAVLKELEQTPDANRFALLACAPGQRPLASPELGHSLFGFYLEEGLRGWADTTDAPADQRGLVTVRRLAHFVQARVDRWAQQNRQTRQTPLLVGSADDFPLVALTRGVPSEHLTLATPNAYPAWLTSAWKTRQIWWNDDRHRSAPWLFRQLEAVALKAERDWAGGGDEKRVRATLQAELDRLEKSFAPLAKASRPDPQSLAQAHVRGSRSDPALAEAVHVFLLKMDDVQRRAAKPEEAKARTAKLTEDLLDLFKSKSELEVGSAFVQSAYQDPFPKRSTFVLFDQLLNKLQPEPKFAEVMILRRLARLADATRDDDWPVAGVRKVLALTRQGEAAACRPFPSAWLRGPLEAAAEKRFEAEVLFFGRGFASPTDAERNLDEALADIGLLKTKLDILDDGQRTLDEAFAQLPWFVPYFEKSGADDQAWHGAVRATEGLAELLIPDDPPAPSEPVKLEEIRQLTQELRGLLATLHTPFGPATLDDLKKQALGPDAAPEQAASLESLREVPWLTADDRADLWKTTRTLGDKLAKRSLAQDADDAQKPATAPVRPADLDRIAREDQERHPAQVRRVLALLRLTGIKPNQLHALEKMADDLNPDWPVLTNLIRLTWAHSLVSQFADETLGGRRERQARVWPSWSRPPNLVAALTQATSTPRRQAEVANWTWLADRYRHESLAPDAPAFLSRAAFALRDYAPNTPPAVRFASKATVVDINPTKPALPTSIPLQRTGGPTASPLEAGIVQADEQWLKIALNRDRFPPSPEARSSMTIPLEVALQPSAEISSAPRPTGFFLRLRTNTRVYFHKVLLPNLPNPERIEILLSADPQQPSAPFGDLRLRPSQSRQSFFVFVRNGTDRSRNIQAELIAEKSQVPGGIVNLTVTSRQTVRLPFPGVPHVKGTATSPGTIELPILQGPLTIRLLDKDTNETITQREININQASPREYIRVPSIRFQPAPGGDAAKNRLEMTLKATSVLAGPPCVVELVLPPSRIPGLKAVRDGVFRGELDAPGAEAKLYAAALQFEPGADEQGYVYINVDGIARALIFQTTFARFGEPTTPREEDRPAIRIVSERYFRTGSPWDGTIEVDHPPTRAKLEICMGRQIDGVFSSELGPRVLSPRQQGVGFRVADKGGALEFETFNRDWRFTFDNVPVRGERMIRVRLLSAEDKEIVRPVYHVVIFDDQMPEKVTFVELPKQTKRDQPLVVQATGLDRGAGIREVLFFLGQAGEDGKLPKDAIKAPGQAVDGKDNLWTASLPLPLDMKGPQEVGVKFTNHVGLSTFAKGTVELVDFDPVKNAAGTVQGVVVEGDIPQPGLGVVLLDAKGNKIAEKVTDGDGAFFIDGIPPGRYTVATFKPTSQRRASREITIMPGQPVRVRLELFL